MHLVTSLLSCRLVCNLNIVVRSVKFDLILQFCNSTNAYSLPVQHTIIDLCAINKI